MKFSKYALPKFRYNELKNFCLQYSWYKYVSKAIEEGTYDVNKYARDFGFKEKDPTALKGMLASRCSSRADAIEKCLIMVAPDDETRKYLFGSVIDEVGYYRLRHSGLNLSQDEFGDLRMRFFWELSREVF